MIGLRSDVDMRDLFIAGVISGPVAEEFAVLETGEEEFTRWVMELDVPDADTAAARAYVQCRTDEEVERESAGALLQAVLADVSIGSRRGGDVSAGAVCIWVGAGADAYVCMSGTGGTENGIDYDPAEHHGWCVVYGSGAAGAAGPVVLHDGSGCRDFRADITAVVERIRRFLIAVRRARQLPGGRGPPDPFERTGCMYLVTADIKLDVVVAPECADDLDDETRTAIEAAAFTWQPDIDALREAATRLRRINDWISGGVDMEPDTAELLRNLLPRPIHRLLS
ncbi:hypothetical protein ACQPXS_45280 [Streptomyces sp. CA-142005]|uniref:hypothetical protein n=1 Tax=Streptomyces sp. CA-142005 TaxID=3240052 RepID=UPI003D90FA24